MGRAPTSGNCHTCRKRRVKCDKTKPGCNRCLRSGYICEGYEAVLRIQSHAAVAGTGPGQSQLGTIQSMTSFPIVGGPVDLKKGKRRAARRVVGKEAEKAGKEAEAAAGGQEAEGAGPAGRGGQGRTGRTGQPGAQIAGQAALAAFWESPPAELSLAGFVDDMSFSYFFQSYGWINMHSLLLQDASMRVRLHDSTGMTYDSLRALCYGLFARDKAVPSLKDTARRMYGQAIGTLRAKIMSTSKQELAKLVKPISLMGSYSITVEQDLRFTHHAGLAQILEFCGPEYFQSPALLPIFESVRWTLISDAMVRRKQTFLERPEWKTVPWALSPRSKSAAHKLLDILASIPTIVEGVWGVMADRFEWLLRGCAGPPREQPDTVVNLQAGVRQVEAAVAEWRRDWEAANPGIAPRIVSWAFSRAADDTYRPGIYGMLGPDVFDASLESLSASLSTGDPLGGDATSTLSVAALMQDAALYTTALVWTTRLNKYLGGAARGPTCVDFFTAPFHTNCACCNTVPPGHCETIPPAEAVPHIDPALNWNTTTCTVAVAPVRMSTTALPGQSAGSVFSSTAQSGSLSPPSSTSVLVSASSPSSHSESKSPNPRPPLLSMTQSPDFTIRPPPESLYPEIRASPLGASVLLPGDVRFAAQLRILSWLTQRLPHTRSHVLGTLAAIGLGHCAHDVRPVEGITEVAAVAVAQVLDSTGFDGANGILLRRY